ncbi:unnamed protein product [Cercopithifilaria johnstoni]|uniref:Uncharacterized protein n=1 Tax=Cercopithifilaria johnstoni TaxID=2874296 RepID=A0A8J2Q2A9_9BILA|nr:unnamed protein product [Cercopithifilaria johnstoni]
MITIKYSVYEKQTLKPKQPGEWDREWDAGKISVENWKENVPNISNNRGFNAHFLHRMKNRSSGARYNSNVTSKKIAEMEKKQKLEGAKVIACVETNKNTSLPNKKIFDGKNSKNLKSSSNGKDGSDDGTILRNTYCVVNNRLKQSHISSNEQSNRQRIGNYTKSSSGSSRKRYSIRRVTSTAATVSMPTTVKKQLDTVKVNVSMLKLKKDVAKTIDKSNNNIDKVDNNLQKLSTIAVGNAAISTAPIQTIAEEYGN